MHLSKISNKCFRTSSTCGALINACHYYLNLRFSSLNRQVISLQAESHFHVRIEPQVNVDTPSTDEIKFLALIERPNLAVVKRPKLVVAVKPKLAIVESKSKNVSHITFDTKDKTTQTEPVVIGKKNGVHTMPTNEEVTAQQPSTSSSGKENGSKVQKKVESKKPTAEKQELDAKSSIKKPVVAVKTESVEKKIQEKIAVEPTTKPSSSKKTKTNEPEVKNGAAKASLERQPDLVTSKDSVQRKTRQTTPNSSNGNVTSTQAAANEKKAVQKSDDTKSNGNKSTKSNTVNPIKSTEISNESKIEKNITSQKSATPVKASAPKVSIPAKKSEPTKGPNTPTVTSPTPPHSPTTHHTKDPRTSVSSTECLKIEHTIPVTPPVSSKTATKPVLITQTPTPSVSTAKQPTTKNASKKRSKK